MTVSPPASLGSVRRNEILLVEDGDDDVELTLRAFSRNKVPSHVHVVRDGVQALEYLLGTADVPALPARARAA